MIAGVSISFILGLMGIADASTVATYAVCGLLAGIFSRFGKLGAVLGFIIGNAVWVYLINASTEVIIPIGEIVVASAILFFMPKKITDFVDDMFDYTNSLEGRDPVGLLTESTIFKLKAVSDVAEDMASNVEKPEAEVTTGIGDFIKTLNENTCKKCENFNKCWNENYHAMYETVFNSVEILQEKNVIQEKDIINDICVKKANLAEGLNFSYEIYKLNKDWQGKINENKKLVAKQLRGVSKAITNVKDEIDEEDLKDNLLGAGFKLEVGMAKLNKKDSKVSGDTTEFARLRNGKVMLGLGDGMGSGENAAKSSKKVLELFQKYINTGLDKNEALDLINSYMLLGENKNNYSTLDAVIFNPNDAMLEFIKFGACPTFIKQGNEVTILSSKSLPVGATANIDIEVFEKRLDRGDYFVLVSDGILEATDKKEEWIKDLLSSISTNKPQRIADIILQEAIDINFGVSNDDMTVVVAKVC